MLARVSSGYTYVAAFGLLLGCGLLAGCRMESGQPVYLIPGPAVPSEVPTQAPYTWDAREELEAWISNAVSHGPVSLDGAGREAVMRIATGSAEWAVRGPDLDPPAHSVQDVRIRARWAQDRQTTQPSSTSMTVCLQPLDESVYQPCWYFISIRSSGEWVDVQLERHGAQTVFDVRYAYLYSAGGGNTGVLEIDRIELIRQAEP
jgi:hypothetical protein